MGEQRKQGAGPATVDETVVSAAVAEIRRTGSLRALEGLEDAQVMEVVWTLLQWGEEEAASRIVETAFRNLYSPAADFRLRACDFLLGMHRLCAERGRRFRLGGCLGRFVEALEREEDPRAAPGLLRLVEVCLAELQEAGSVDAQVLARLEGAPSSLARRGGPGVGGAAYRILDVIKVGREAGQPRRSGRAGEAEAPVVGAPSPTRMPEGVAGVVRALKTGELEHSPAVISACRDMGAPLLEALSGFLEGNVREEVVLRAIELLGLVGGNGALEVVKKAADHPIPEVRARALACLRRMSPGDHRLLPLLMRALRDEETAVRREAVRGLGDIDDPQCVDTLLSILQRKSPRGGAEHPSVEEAACLALGRLGPESAVPTLVNLLRRRPLAVWRREAHPRVKAAACRALAEIGGPEAAELIRDYLDDPDPILRNEARKAVAVLRNRGLLD